MGNGGINKHWRREILGEMSFSLSINFAPTTTIYSSNYHVQGEMVHTFAVESVVWSYHEYKDICLIDRRELPCEREPGSQTVA